MRAYDRRTSQRPAHQSRRAHDPAQFLDYTRKTALAKCDGLSDQAGRKAPLQSTLLGGEDEGPWTAEDPDREFHYMLDRPLSDLLAGYVEQSRRYDEMLAGLDLEMPTERRMRGGEQVNLRWIIHHLIEENARHNGHLDILREMADGATGT